MGYPGLFSIKRAALEGGFFLFHSISSEYQIQPDLLPGFRGNFGVEVFVYQSLLLSFGARGLDKISTEAGKVAKGGGAGLRDRAYG